MEKSLMSILIVEDLEAVAASLGAVLQGEGYNKILYAASAEEAFTQLGINGDQIQPRDVDLVLMDVMMPGMNGIEACRFIKTFKPYQDLPVIIVTAKEEAEVLFAAFEAGAVDYIVKPVKRLELISRVGSILRLKHEMDRRKMWERKLLEVTVQLNEAKQTIERLTTCKNSGSCVSDSRSFNELFRNEWELAIQKESPISLLMVNVDCFREFKEQHGDQCAEECMEKVGGALCEAMKRKRPGDFVTRYGCDDYAVVLPTTDISGALIVAERIKSHVAALEIVDKKTNTIGKLTVSVGLASAMPTRTTTTKLLIAAADEALYLARQEGGNRIKMAAG